jgi:glycosyltransferase involved in cell wall biosynthesis
MSMHRDVRLAFVTNLMAPYWKPVFEALVRRYPHMRVLLSTRMESNRPWKVDWEGLDVVLQKTITVKRRWRHSRGFTEPIYVHLPLDTVRQLRSFGADVVISNEMGFRTLLALRYRKTHPNSRLIVWSEMSESTEQGRGRARCMLRQLIRKRADAFVVLGDSGARYIRSLGTDDRKIFRVPYTTDIARFAANSLPRPQEYARRLLYVGQLIERKGLLQFLESLSRWASGHAEQRVELVLTGDGPLRGRLEREPVPSNVRLTFMGNVAYEDLPRVYAQSGIFVFPTLADTWGLVVNEALASGLPVLGSVYSQAVEELIEDNSNGWVFRADEPEELYGAIDRSMNTPLDELSEMRQRARATVLGLTPAHVATLIDNAVTACIQSSARWS